VELYDNGSSFVPKVGKMWDGSHFPWKDVCMETMCFFPLRRGTLLPKKTRHIGCVQGDAISAIAIILSSLLDKDRMITVALIVSP